LYHVVKEGIRRRLVGAKQPLFERKDNRLNQPSNELEVFCIIAKTSVPVFTVASHHDETVPFSWIQNSSFVPFWNQF